jgi:glutamate-ammonia-ligase adenylyltransferase
VAERFASIRCEVLAQPKDGQVLREEVPAMRRKMRSQPGADPFKHGPGGLLDIDFLAQLGILEAAPGNPELRQPTSTREQLRSLAGHGWIDEDEATVLIETHGALTRARHLRALLREDGRFSRETVPDTSEAQAICRRHGILDAADGGESR